MRKKNIDKFQEDFRIRTYLDKTDNKYKSRKYEKIFGFDNMTFSLSKDNKIFIAYIEDEPVMKLKTNEFGITYKMSLSKRLGYLEDYLKIHFYGKEIKMYDDKDDPFID